jgi:inhibitor of the pro-sigma K processing machinery
MLKIADIIINFCIRALIGMAAIFFLNEFLVTKGIETVVGLNIFSGVVSGIFGLPGVALLYGVGFY